MKMTSETIETVIAEIRDRISSYVDEYEVHPNKREDLKQEMKCFTIEKVCLVFGLNEEDYKEKPILELVSDLYKVVAHSQFVQTNRTAVACFLALLNLLNAND